MKKKLIDWIVEFIAGMFGFRKIPEVEIDKTNWAKDAEEVVRKEQEEKKKERDKEWDEANEEQKKKILLDRFNAPDNRD